MPRRSSRSKSRAPRWLAFWSVVLLVCLGAGAAAYWVGRNVIGEWGAQGTPIRDLTTNLLAEEKEEGKTAWETRARRSQHAAPIVEVVPAEPTEEAEAQQPEAEAGGEQEERATGAEREDSKAEGGTKPAATGPERATGPTGPERTVEERQPAPKVFVVRAGSFTDDKYLQERKAALVQRGYHPWVTEYEQDGTVYRRVNVGEFQTQEEARLLQKELAQSGIDADVVSRGARER